MKLDRAMEIMQTGPPESSSISAEDEEAAANLAIEAMQRLQVGRLNPGTHWNDPLPGETKD